MTSLQDIDPLAPGLSAGEKAMLLELIKVRDAYCLQGRGREYHAFGKALLVVWHHLQRRDGPAELPRTDFGALDVALPMDAPGAAAPRANPPAGHFSPARAQVTPRGLG